jgi:hypothetical protein
VNVALVLAWMLAPATAEPVEASRAIEPEAAAAPLESPPTEEPTPAPTDATATPPAEAAPETPAEPEVETVRAKVASGNKQTQAPFYDPEDIRAVRKKHGIDPDMDKKVKPRTAKWRCLIADPVCGFNAEVNATSAYAGRFKQGDVREDDLRKWSSGRAQYDVWINIPVLVETIGRERYTRMTLGPKAGAIFSDTGDTWGNLGLAMRYWLGRGKWAPTIELTTALSFKIARRPTNDLAPDEKPKYEMHRGPVGITGDIGVGLGGFGAIIFGGQYDSPLAREDVPERFRTSSSGMLFVGFRGNILWGAPAAAAVMTHGLTQRYAREDGG